MLKIKPIIIIAGEPNSVFLEIFFKTLKKSWFKKFLRPIILIASSNLILDQMTKLGFNFKIRIIKPNFKNNFGKIDNTKINVINVNLKYKKPFENISTKSNFYLNHCFKIGIDIMKKNLGHGLINGPISKKKFLNGKFLGITEYLADKTNTKNKIAMLIYNKNLSVSPITTHLPLKDVHKRINQKKIMNNVKLINLFYKKKFNKKPKIAITGLNPHCESNYKTSEEKKIIIPAIKKLIKQKYHVKGPFPADTIFLKDQLKRYDVIIGMYHDQVLAPLKTLFDFNAINITLGLPFVRISPDHGPNFSMLGKNLSNPQSLIEAIKFLEN